jgi:hypothetical protein
LQVVQVQSAHEQLEQLSPPHDAQEHTLWLQVVQVQVEQLQVAQTSSQSAHWHGVHSS